MNDDSHVRMCRYGLRSLSETGHMRILGSGNNTDASRGHNVICQALAPVLHFKILLVAVKRSSITVQRKFPIIRMYLLATADKK